ncbi:MAG: hypothetical protein Q9175_003191 [Cornicularia normoerica]
MTSSKNRFHVLGEEASSSEEQETQPGAQVPITGTKDQTTQGADQSGPSAPQGKIVAEFMKLEADAKAKFDEDERRKISRQGDSLTFVGTQMPSTTPSQDLPMRTVSFDEMEESSKRRRVGPLSLIQAVGEPAIATPSTKKS